MADLEFERGDPLRPSGHAFLYFASGVAGDVLATYLVVPPVAIEFAKYVPPLLASSLGSSGLIAQTSFLPIPPAPETVSLDEVRRLARRRGDDVLVERGAVGSDLGSMMMRVAEIGEAYATAYQRALADGPEEMPQEIAEGTRTDARDSNEGLALLYSVLSERERMEEIARRVGTLRYAVQGGDAGLAETAGGEIRAVGRYLPAGFRLDELVLAASRPGDHGDQLTKLYVRRGYALCDADEVTLAAVDAEIAAVQSDNLC
jgi:hypothetical protein